MTRRKFPDDERDWFRCLTDILYDEKLNGDCPPEVAWFYVRLLALLKQTGSKDGSISLDRRALGFCACRAQHRHSLRIARAGAVRGLYTMSPLGEGSESTQSPLGEGSESTRSPLGEGSESTRSPLGVHSESTRSPLAHHGL